MIKITDREFNQLAEFIKSNYGIFLKKEKKALVMGRLQNVLQAGGFSNFTDYFQYVISDKSGAAVNIMIDKITTNHTFFMRETDHFFIFEIRYCLF